MANNINSASRLHALLKKASGNSAQTQILEVWANLFEVAEANPNKKSIAVAERLGSMFREVNLIREQMDKTDFGESLYSSALSKIELALSTMILSGTWNSAQQYLTPETLVALEFCGEILPDEEALISSEELAEIRSRVKDLQESLSSSQLPPRLRTLVEHHIDLILRALAEYPIAGAMALREAARTGLGEFMEVSETVKANRGAPEISMLGAVWDKVNKAADVALKAEKLAQLGQKAWSMLENIL